MSIDHRDPFDAVNDVEVALLRSLMEDLSRPSFPLRCGSVADLSLEGEQPNSIASIIAEVNSTVVPNCVRNRHVWSLAHMVPPPATVSVVADMVIGALNQCAFIWEEAPIAKTLESEVIRWLANCIGLPLSAGGLLTSGGTMSNCLAVYLALQRAKKHNGVDISKFRIVASDQAHFSIEKAVSLCGLDKDSIVRVRTNSEARLTPGDIVQAASQLMSDGLQPILFICTSGTTNAGILEPAVEIVQAARQSNAWVHIDAAYGGLVSLSRQASTLVEPWRTADSISWDPHKTLYTTYSIGALLLTDPRALSALDFRADYALNEEQHAHDAGAFHLEGSRRLEALKAWMTIKYFGKQGFSTLIDYTLTLARMFADFVATTGDFELVTRPDTNVICFRYADLHFDNVQLDALNITVQKRLFRNGGPLLSTTKIDGRTVLRMVLLNPRTTFADLLHGLD